MIRVGLGYDVHPFGTHGSLVMGGVTVTDAPALVGHSDADVAKRVAREGWWIGNVDVAVAAERPKLGPHTEAMAANVAAALDAARQPMGRGIHVAVRPKRGEGLGFVGRAEGIAVWAVALLERA